MHGEGALSCFVHDVQVACMEALYMQPGTLESIYPLDRERLHNICMHHLHGEAPNETQGWDQWAFSILPFGQLNKVNEFENYCHCLISFIFELFQLAMGHAGSSRFFLGTGQL